MRGITGRLARENAVRQPGRTAATAAALMVGVALVAFASIFAASARKTIHDAVSNGSHAQFIIQNTDGFSAFSPQAAKSVAQIPGVQKVSPLRFAQGKVGKQDVSVTGIDPATFPDLYRVGQHGAAAQPGAWRRLRVQGLQRRPPPGCGASRQDGNGSRRSRCASPASTTTRVTC